MSDIIQNTINSVIGDGARPTKFKCQIMPPQELMQKYNITYKDLDVYCYTSRLPGVTNQVVDYKWKGRAIPLKGIHEYEQKISCTFYVDESHKIRQLFIDWILHSQNQNYFDINRVKSISELIPNSIHIYQMDYELYKETVLYSLIYAFPTNVSEIELNYESLNQIENFTVEFTFSHFEINTIENGGLTANDIADKIKNTIQNVVNSAVDKAKNIFKEHVLDPVSSYIGNKLEGFSKSLKENIDDFIVC